MTTITANTQFDAIIAAEADLKLAEALHLFGETAAMRARGERNVRENRQFVEGALELMDFDTFREFHAYRTARAERLGLI